MPAPIYLRVFEVLGIEPTNDFEIVKNAFLKLEGDLEVFAAGDPDPEKKELYDEDDTRFGENHQKFYELQLAYSFVCSKERLANYNAFLAKKTPEKLPEVFEKKPITIKSTGPSNKVNKVLAAEYKDLADKYRLEVANSGDIGQLDLTKSLEEITKKLEYLKTRKKDIKQTKSEPKGVIPSANDDYFKRLDEEIYNLTLQKVEINYQINLQDPKHTTKLAAYNDAKLQINFLAHAMNSSADLESIRTQMALAYTDRDKLWMEVYNLEEIARENAYNIEDIDIIVPGKKRELEEKTRKLYSTEAELRGYIKKGGGKTSYIQELQKIITTLEKEIKDIKDDLAYLAPKATPQTSEQAPEAAAPSSYEPAAAAESVPAANTASDPFTSLLVKQIAVQEELSLKINEFTELTSLEYIPDSTLEIDFSKYANSEGINKLLTSIKALEEEQKRINSELKRMDYAEKAKAKELKLTRLMEEIETLSQVTSQLQRKLESMLKNTDEAGRMIVENVEEYVTLEEQIKQNNTKIEDLNAQLNALLTAQIDEPTPTEPVVVTESTTPMTPPAAAAESTTELPTRKEHEAQLDAQYAIVPSCYITVKLGKLGMESTRGTYFLLPQNSTIQNINFARLANTVQNRIMELGKPYTVATTREMAEGCHDYNAKDYRPDLKVKGQDDCAVMVQFKIPEGATTTDLKAVIPEGFKITDKDIISVRPLDDRTYQHSAFKTSHLWPTGFGAIFQDDMIRARHELLEVKNEDLSGNSFTAAELKEISALIAKIQQELETPMFSKKSAKLALLNELKTLATSGLSKTEVLAEIKARSYSGAAQIAEIAELLQRLNDSILVDFDTTSGFDITPTSK